jgi:hypothetical protein
MAWARNNILGLVAIVIALGGSAAAASVVVQRDSKGSSEATASKKAKKGPRGPAGPQGPQGPQGIQGIQGVPGGASIGAADGPGTPPATANRSLAEVFINLPQPAKVFVTGSTTQSVTCNAAGTCSSRIGLYVDSIANPIAQSEYDIDSTASTTVTKDGTMVGVTGILPAGGHVFRMYSTDVGNVASIGSVNSNIAAIVLTG